MKKPVIAIAMGDAAGIGPELIVKVLTEQESIARVRPVVIGDLNVLRAAVNACGIDLRVRSAARVSEAGVTGSTLTMVQPDAVDITEFAWGALSPNLGKAAALCLEEALRLASLGKIDGIVSAPINKQAFHMAGYDYADELAWISEITRSPQPFLMGLVGGVWTVTVTGHVPFGTIAGLITKDEVLRSILRLDSVLNKIRLPNARIAVAALNVHAGEGGLYGLEEIEAIRPAIDSAKEHGVDVTGPHAADTVFVGASEGAFDGVVCMYHDQANIARKLLAHRGGATFFMGLPFPFGTTAHGTAFDIAGRGTADPNSLREALRYTSLLASGDYTEGVNP